MNNELPERYFYKRNNFTKIGKILTELFPKKTRGDTTINKIKNAWKSIVGDEIFQSTEIIGLKKRVLYINVESTALIHHLTSFERYAIITRINETVGKECIEDIRFKAGNIEHGKR